MTMSKWIKEIIVRYDDKQSFIYGNTLGEVVGELVRCKECKWGEVVRNHSIGFCKNQCGVRSAITESSYCSYGEREGE